MTKIDYFLAGFAGFLTGVFAVPTVFSLGVKIKFVLLVLPLVVPIVFVLGVWLGGKIAKKISFFGQFSKFVAVGFLNTAIDFGVLNIISSLTGVTAGLVVGGINIPGFAAAVFNSYFWNKFWVFKDRDKESVFKDLPKFLVVTGIGVLLNSGIVILATTYATPLADDPKVWLNMAKAGATIANLVWNFLGYKFIVFSRN